MKSVAAIKSYPTCIIPSGSGIVFQMKSSLILGSLLLLATLTAIKAESYDLDALLAPRYNAAATEIYSDITSTAGEADIYDFGALLAPSHTTVVTDIYSGTTVTATTRQVSPQREVISIKSSTGSEITGVTKIEPITGKRTTILNVFQAR